MPRAGKMGGQDGHAEKEENSKCGKQMGNTCAGTSKCQTARL